MSCMKENKYCREGVEGGGGVGGGGVGGAHNQYNRCPKDQLDEFRYVASVSADTHTHYVKSKYISPAALALLFP